MPLFGSSQLKTNGDNFAHRINNLEQIAARDSRDRIVNGEALAEMQRMIDNLSLRVSYLESELGVDSYEDL